jgi:inorganic pyrophosphatase
VATHLHGLPPEDEEGFIRVVIESPQGARHKLKYEPRTGVFALSKTLPAGLSFPFDFGFIPQTKAADGDPLDVLVLMDAPTYPGVVVPVTLLGLIEAEQTDHGGPVYRNDRLIAVADGSTSRGDLRSMSDLDDQLLGQVETFFGTYCKLTGKTFRAIGRGGKRAALEAFRKARTTR